MTEEAKRMVHALARMVLPEGQSLRLETAKASGIDGEEGVVMCAEGPKEGDEPVAYQGELLLYVSRRVSAAYDGCVVDLEQTPRGIAFSIGPPVAGRNARS